MNAKTKFINADMFIAVLGLMAGLWHIAELGQNFNTEKHNIHQGMMFMFKCFSSSNPLKSTIASLKVCVVVVVEREFSDRLWLEPSLA